MVRPRKQRLVQKPPRVEYFKPRGIPLKRLQETCLTVEGVEALRLADLEGLNQEQAAKRMHVSRQTFGRVLAKARNAVAEAVVSGRALRIDGGDYRLARKHEAAGVGAHDNAPNPAPAPQVGECEVNAMSKIAITSEGPNLSDQVDPRFGRAAGFIVIDPDTKESAYVSNGQNQTRGQGAGIAAAELMAQNQVNVVLTGFVGPKAFQALDAAGIQVGQNLDNLTTEQALQRYLDGQVEMATRPNR